MSTAEVVCSLCGGTFAASEAMAHAQDYHVGDRMELWLCPCGQQASSLPEIVTHSIYSKVFLVPSHFFCALDWTTIFLAVLKLFELFV